MHALAFDRFGGPKVLRWRAMPDPEPRPGYALVRIRAAGLNFADVYRRNGNYHLSGNPPWILGYEGAGTIVSLEAPNDHGLSPGDRVAFADSPFANAELISAPLDKLIPLPADITEEMAAALLLQGLTAQYLLRDSYKVRRGDVVLVWAAAGGVGLILCQLAAHAGADVIGIASSSEKREAVLAAGAGTALCYEDWEDRLRAIAPEGADVVYDSVGTTLGKSLSAARTGGTVVFFGMADGDPDPVDPRSLMDRSLALVGDDLWNVLTSAEIRRMRASELFKLVRTGNLKVRIAAQVPMADGAEAHRLLESRSIVGKVILTL